MSIVASVKKLFKKEAEQEVKAQDTPAKETKEKPKGKHGEDFCCGGCS